MSSDASIAVELLADQEHHEPEPPILSVHAAIKDIAFGSFAGMVSEVVEYPFDLAKVRLQSQLLSASSSDSRLRFNGPLDCLMQTWRDEGFRGLYRGLPAPVVGSMAETASLFLAYSSFQNLIRSHYPTVSPTFSFSDPKPPQLTIPQLGLAAAGAGFVTSFILTPVELVKCKMQVQMMNMHTSAHIPPIHVYSRPIPTLPPPIHVPPAPALHTEPSLTFLSKIYPRSFNTSPSLNPASIGRGKQLHTYPGPITIIRSTIRTHGLHGLWLGHTGTLLRETGGTAAWFTVKEWVAGALRDRRLEAGSSVGINHFATIDVGVRDSTLGLDLLPWESALSGAIAGAACVLALYPADTVKSAIQTEEEMRSSTPSAQRSKRSPLTSPTASSPTQSYAPTSSDSVIRPRNNSFWRTLTRMYALHGLRGLYAGCGMTVARAVPSSGIVFLVYDGLCGWVG